MPTKITVTADEVSTSVIITHTPPADTSEVPVMTDKERAQMEEVPSTGYVMNEEIVDPGETKEFIVPTGGTFQIIDQPAETE